MSAQISRERDLPRQDEMSREIGLGWQPLARALWWLILSLEIVLLFVGSLAVFDLARSLPERALAILIIAGLELTAAAISIGIATLIFRRRGTEKMAYLLSLVLIPFGAPDIVGNARVALPVLAVPAQLILLFQFLMGGIVLTTFPNGKFAPRWTRLVLMVFGLFGVFGFRGSLGLWFVLGYALWAIYFIGLQTYRYQQSRDFVERQQAKWVIFGIALQLAGVAVLALLQAGVLPLDTSAHVILVLLALLLQLAFPVSVLFAILRQHLYRIDLLLNRTFVYVPLTAILAGIFAGANELLMSDFKSMAGEQSVTAISTLIVVAVFDPLKKKLQDRVDKHFKPPTDPVKALEELGRTVEADIGFIDPQRLMQRFLKEAVGGFHATGGAIFLGEHGNDQPVQTGGEWNGNSAIDLYMISRDEPIGRIALGARTSGASYSSHERTALQGIANLMAEALAPSLQRSGVQNGTDRHRLPFDH